MTKKQNHARAFNSVMHYANERWAAEVLGMQKNFYAGIDLIGKKADVEVKFCIQTGGYNHICWRILEYQMDYQKSSRAQGKPAYWGLAKYWLLAPVQEIRASSSEDLERLVKKRELIIVPWEWMHQFPAYHQSGRTNFSRWDHKIRFAKGSKLPKIILSFQVKKGIVHLTEGITQAYFPALKANA